MWIDGLPAIPSNQPCLFTDPSLTANGQRLRMIDGLPPAWLQKFLILKVRVAGKGSVCQANVTVKNLSMMFKVLGLQSVFRAQSNPRQ
jgi:hypothetical protein